MYVEIYEDVWGSDPVYFLEQGPRTRAEFHLDGIMATGRRVRFQLSNALNVRVGQ